MFSAFDIIGPPMVGPSSSHTAGACRLGLLARGLLDAAPDAAELGLHGSFAATGVGHATDRALVAGILNMAPDDERLKDALEIARQSGVEVRLGSVDLGEMIHPNSVRIRLSSCGRQVEMVGSSVGGGAVVTAQIDGYPAEIRGQLETLALWHQATPGFLARIVSVCACVGLNIAAVRTSRHERGEAALTTIEVDGEFAADVLSVLGRGMGVHRLAHLRVLPGF